MRKDVFAVYVTKARQACAKGVQLARPRRGRRDAEESIRAIFAEVSARKQNGQAAAPPNTAPRMTMSARRFMTLRCCSAISIRTKINP
jgi:hypothetical protein